MLRTRGHGQQDFSVFRSFWTLALLGYLLAFFVTKSWTLNYESRWLHWGYIKHRLLEPTGIEFTEQELALYDGSDAHKPVYLAINGTVFDVSTRRETYGPIGPYHFFAGRDAARAYATGCFQTDLTHDLRNLTASQLEAVRGWHQFFNNSKRYWPVGHVKHGPLTGEPPAPCQGRPKPS